MIEHEIARLIEGRQADFAFCEQIIRRNSLSFYGAFSLLPRFKAQCVFAVYAFCRGADDAVDREKSADRLNALSGKLDGFFAGRTPDEPVFRALEAVHGAFPLPKQPFRDMIMGQGRDLAFTQPADQAALERYCYEVAGSVGLMLLPLLSRRAAELTEAAVGLGIAMQLTNILRDVGEDARMGRIYFPVSAMAASGYPIENLKAGVVDEAFVHLWEDQAARAEALYDAFEAQAHLLDDDSRPATLAALLMYRGILNAVRQNGYRCFDRRASVTSAERNRILSPFLPEVFAGGDAGEALS